MVVVFGSINVDFVMRAPVLPAPGETVLGGSYLLAPGGKGANQACAAALAGFEAAMVGCVGADDWGRFALERLAAAGVDLSAVARTDTPTGCASILVDAGGENVIAVASGANLEVGAERLPGDRLGPGATVVLQMEVPAEATFEVVARARAAGARTVLNVAPARAVPASTLDAVEVLVVNEVEARVVAEATPDASGQEPLTLATALADAHDLVCVVTLGAEGLIAASREAWFSLPALAVEVVDTTGAGDAFTGVLAGALDAGLALEAALRRAGVAGALACTGSGAQSAYADAAAIEEALAAMPEVTRDAR